MKIRLLFLLCGCLFLLSCSGKQEPLIRTSLRHYYEPYRVNGFLALEDPSRETILVSDPTIFRTAFTPASTFKICHSLIALETGVIKDESTVMKWDSVDRDNPNWNKDQNLTEAFQNSTVWYYQEVARRIGGTRMKTWLEKADYGNADTTGGIDKFWLKGGLRISPEQQLQFIQKLHKDQLPFSKRSMDIVKKMMVSKDSAGFVLRGKTGWGNQETIQVGWFVGYAETEDRVVYFANLVRMADSSSNDMLFDQSRRGVVSSALNDYFSGTLK